MPPGWPQTGPGYAFTPAPPPLSAATKRPFPFAMVAILSVLILSVLIGGLVTLNYFKIGPFAMPSVESAAPELKPLGGLAKVVSRPVNLKVGPDNPASLSLTDGASIQVPKGAFSKPNELTAVIVELDVSGLAFGTRKVTAYVIRSESAADSLAAPVVVELPIPEGTNGYAQFDGKTWRNVKPPPGERAKFEIRHFSTSISLPFFAGHGAGGEGMGRAMFGLGAVAAATLGVAFAVRALRLFKP